ncbi:MAG: T9SS type A sorting domain-containing protein [Crocinitomix sp.]|nr:T9SS type A sorting domain-containing protein [Crocinitomix sp.]
MISIPEPCNEDFTKMTPTERGAFCGKCQIDTFDFRDLSTADINKAILQNKGQHLCGQFKGSQIDTMNQGFMNWKNQKKQTFRSKFVLALVMVFGLTLFSCNSQEEKAIVELQTMELFANPIDKVAYINAVQNEQDLDLVDFVDEIEVIGCEAAIPGKMVMEVFSEPLDPELFYEGEVTAGVPDYQIAGGMVAPNYWDYLEDTLVDSTEESNLPEVTEIDPDYFEAKAYPNPTTSDATIALDIHKAGQFEVVLYDMSGREVQTIYSGELVEGRQNFQVELAKENSGMYIVKVLSNGQNETVKIQKVN